ncbi:putative uncharacterized protein [Dialister sp. CAG:588]|nr:putative uncharacterized protein [Dialister sp. CAG:588]
MIHSIFNSVMGFGITGILVAIIGFWLFGRFVKGIITNIVLGGVLYLFLDWFHICKMNWSSMDGIIVALAGIPGTIILAIAHSLF